MFIDEVTITVAGGKGGDGAVSFRKNEGNPRGGPDGGNGGHGGDIYFRGTDDLTALQKFQYKKAWKAEDGVPGKRKNLYGKNAEELVIDIPLGTRVTDSSGSLLLEITNAETKHLVVRGGKGGRGNNEFKSATNQAPLFAEKGEAGEEKTLQLELRLIADIGLIGLPNAGKSTLLSVLTSAKPKIGNYPFTTLEPNVGMMDRIMLADIPGLIEGASHGKGLGFKFLRHIEKTKLLVHCIDSSSPDVLKDYQTVQKEFENYNKELLEKPMLIVLTKVDQINQSEIEQKIKELNKTSRRVLTASVMDEETITILKDVLRALLVTSLTS